MSISIQLAIRRNGDVSTFLFTFLYLMTPPGTLEKYFSSSRQSLFPYYWIWIDSGITCVFVIKGSIALISKIECYSYFHICTFYIHDRGSRIMSYSESIQLENRVVVQY